MKIPQESLTVFNCDIFEFHRFSDIKLKTVCQLVASQRALHTTATATGQQRSRRQKATSQACSQAAKK
eukprot:Skav217590  [mRNA]  locus=scaffold3512:84175:85452:+ [translate_table: standard]